MPSWRPLSPGGKTVAARGALVCLALMLSMPASSWWRLGLWLLAGLTVDFLYGWRTGRFKEVVGRECGGIARAPSTDRKIPGGA